MDLLEQTAVDSQVYYALIHLRRPQTEFCEALCSNAQKGMRKVIIIEMIQRRVSQFD